MRISWSLKCVSFLTFNVPYKKVPIILQPYQFTNDQFTCISRSAERLKIVIYEEGWEASNSIGIIVLISLTVTCFIRVAFDRAFWRDKAKSRFVDLTNHFWNSLFRIQMVFPLVRPASSLKRKRARIRPWKWSNRQIFYQKFFFQFLFFVFARNVYKWGRDAHFEAYFHVNCQYCKDPRTGCTAWQYQ